MAVDGGGFEPLLDLFIDKAVDVFGGDLGGGNLAGEAGEQAQVTGIAPPGFGCGVMSPDGLDELLDFGMHKNLLGENGWEHSTLQEVLVTQLLY